MHPQKIKQITRSPWSLLYWKLKIYAFWDEFLPRWLKYLGSLFRCSRCTIWGTLNMFSNLFHDMLLFITFVFDVHFRISFKHLPSNIPDKISCFFWILLVSRDAWCHKMPRCLKLPLHCTPQLKNIYITLGTQGLLYLENNNSKTCRVEIFLRLHHLSQRVKNKYIRLDVSSFCNPGDVTSDSSCLS